MNKNLIPLSERTKEEQREITKKGGIASGKSRKLKKLITTTILKALNTALDAPMTDKDFIKQAKAYGFADEELTNRVGIALSVINKAFNGDIKAIELLIKLMGEMPDKDGLQYPYSEIGINIVRPEDNKVQIYLPDNGRE